MKKDGLLILDADDLGRRAELLFQRLSESSAFRAAFMENPASKLEELMPNARPLSPPTQISQANRLLYAVLSNRQFYVWCVEFQARLERQFQEICYQHEPAEARRILSETFAPAQLYLELIAAARQFGGGEMAGLPPAAATDLALPEPPIGGFSRLDLQRVAAYLAEQLTTQPLAPSRTAPALDA